MRLILASASPRRADLLRAAGYAFEIRAVDVDERWNPGESPADYVRRLAGQKAAQAVRHLTLGEETIVLAADTTVAIGEEVIGKPGDPVEGAGMLRRLSGRTHRVLTGVTARTAAAEETIVEETSVEFAELTEAEIAWYVESGEGLDKAGGYGIQGLASRFIPRIVGSYTNVVGLPVAGVTALLRRLSQPARVLASEP